MVDQAGMARGVNPPSAIIESTIMDDREVGMVFKMLSVYTVNFLLLGVCHLWRVDVEREALGRMWMDDVADHVPVLRTDGTTNGVVPPAHTVELNGQWSANIVSTIMDDRGVVMVSKMDVAREPLGSMSMDNVALLVPVFRTDGTTNGVVRRAQAVELKGQWSGMDDRGAVMVSKTVLVYTPNLLLGVCHLWKVDIAREALGGMCMDNVATDGTTNGVLQRAQTLEVSGQWSGN